MDISLAELEQAINYWRCLRPSSGEERTLSPEVNALAHVYALMIFSRQTVVTLAALDALSSLAIAQWRAQAAAQPGTQASFV
jgi:hypothetical protein